MELEKARKIAEALVEAMRPHCEEIQIAGSIRRGNPNVKDIEICAIPKWRIEEKPVETNLLFAETLEIRLNLLHNWAKFEQTKIKWIKTGTPEIIAWDIKPEGKYWRGLIQHEGEQIKLDLFLTTREQWGVIFCIRTGSREFSNALMSVIKKKTPLRVMDGFLKREATEEIIACPTEESFFDNCGLAFVDVPMRSSSIPYQLLRSIREVK